MRITIGVPTRSAVSISCEFIRNAPSPVATRTFAAARGDLGRDRPGQRPCHCRVSIGDQARVRLVRRVEPGHPHLQGARIDEDNIVALQRCSRIGDNAGRCQREPGVGVASVELTRQKLTDPLATRRGWVIASHRCRQRIKAAAILVRGYGFGATQRRGWSTLSGPGRRPSSRPRRGRQPRADTTADLGVKPSLESRGF